MRWIVIALLAAAPAWAQNVIVNGQPLPPAEQRAVEQRTRVPMVPGRWWYDARSGLWGVEGAGAAGFAPPGLPVSAPLPAGASGGQRNVFFNGRSLSDPEIAWLMTLGTVWPGRYWLDAMGNVGLEGQKFPFANLAVLVQIKAGKASSSTTPGGAWIGSQGGCVAISAKSSSGIGSFGASNC
ncbi:hypothetical protein [Piscinibacterium candidicorallinum]|uniref:Uncharacterized protein n=1 Tax=Piscinibacterium candidicorallinum TaxID=1793872 RepID=A0ABV7H392_9BURK